MSGIWKSKPLFIGLFLTLLTVTSACGGSATPPLAGVGEKGDSIDAPFYEMLKVLPDTPETRSSVIIFDYARIREQFGIQRPGPNAGEEELLEYLQQVARPRLEVPFIMFDPYRVTDSLDLKRYLGFGVQNADQDVVAGVFSRRYEAIKGHFDPEATREALDACYRDPPAVSCRPVADQKTVVEQVSPEEFGTQLSLQDARRAAGRAALMDITGKLLTTDEVELGMSVLMPIGPGVGPPPLQEEHRGVSFYIWGEDFRGNLTDRYKPPAYDSSGRGGRIAVLEQYAFRTLWTAGIQKMIDASQGAGLSLADVPEYVLMATALDDMESYHAFMSDEVGDSGPYLQSLTEQQRSSFLELLTPDAGFGLGQYRALGLGAGEDGEGPFAVIVLVYDQPSQAEADVPVLRRHIVEGERLYLSQSPPFLNMTEVEISVIGRTLIAKLRTDFILLYSNLPFTGWPLLIQR